MHKKKDLQSEMPAENAGEEAEEILQEAAEDPGEANAPAEEPSEEERLREELAQAKERHLRLMAEYDNFRKRSTREREDIYPAATAAAVEKFLPILDNLERAQGYEPGTEEFAKGFAMICQNFKDILAGFGVEAIGEVGEPFDPEKHNAVMHIEDESLGENVVSQVLQKGYRIGERIVRYAMVQTAN